MMESETGCYTKPEVFITGGQTGADSIPFTVARALEINIEGYLPKGYKRDDGRGKEVAEKYGLIEGKGGYRWRDLENARLCDAVCAFLVNRPKTGKGTMQTVNFCTNGVYDFIPIPKPEDADFLEIPPHKPGNKPGIVFWDITGDRAEEFAHHLLQFCRKWKPKRLMFTGSTRETMPNVEVDGGIMVLSAFKKDGNKQDLLEQLDLSFS